MGEVRGKRPQAPGSQFMLPHEYHSLGRDQRSGEGRDLPSPHPALPSWLWDPAFFGQKILPKLRDA